jgi:uncharacterized protein YjiS (DUF1127 family)
LRGRSDRQVAFEGDVMSRALSRGTWPSNGRPADADLPGVATGPLPWRGAAALEAAIRGFIDRSRRRQTIRELRELGDHRLHDIGIEPSQIEAIADDMVRRLRERC